MSTLHKVVRNFHHVPINHVYESLDTPDHYGLAFFNWAPTVGAVKSLKNTSAVSSDGTDAGDGISTI